MDLVIRLSSRDAGVFVALWPPGEFYSPGSEIIEAEIARAGQGHFNVIHNESTMRADVYIAGGDALSEWALQRRVVRQVEGEDVNFAPIEYVIVSKLRYFQMRGSDRHLRDVARMLAVSGPDVDRPILESWIERLKLGAEWAKALAYEEQV